MPLLECNSIRLRARLEQLQRKRKQQGSLTPSELEVLAECAFRLAVSPEATFAESIRLLQLSFRTAGVNPKFAYHLGRKFFRHGRFEEAGRWLVRAAQICPTSHRVWTHIGLLLWERNADFKGNEDYEADSLRKRGDYIAGLIRARVDDFPEELRSFQPTISKALLEKQKRQGQPAPGMIAESLSPNQDTPPPEEINGKHHPAKPKRLLGAGECRWTGIVDLVLERMLESRPSQYQLEKMLPLLEECARHATKRPGGVAGFCVLGMQWIITGYPTTTIRRLLTSLFPDSRSNRAVQLLEQICEVYEAPLAETPGRLAALLENQDIPPLVAAVIHRRRVLARRSELDRDWEFEGVVLYLQARRLLADSQRNPLTDEITRKESTAKASAVATKLNRSIETFLQSEPVPSMKDVQPKPENKATVSSQTPDELFAKLEQSSHALLKVFEDAFRHLKDQVGPSVENAQSPEEVATALADYEAFTPFLATVVASANTCMELLEVAAKALTSPGQTIKVEDFANRHEECDKRFKELLQPGNHERQLRKIGKRLSTANPVAGAAISSAMMELNRRLAAAWTGPFPATGGQEQVSAAERLAQLQVAAESLASAGKSAFAHLRDKLEPMAQSPDEAAYRHLVADRTEFESLLKLMHATGEEGTRRAKELLESVRGQDSSHLPPDFAQAQEDCDKQFKEALNQGNLQKKLRKLDKQLAAIANQFTPGSGQPTEELTALVEKVRNLFPQPMPVELERRHSDAKSRADNTTSGATTVVPQRGRDLPGLAGLAQAIRRTEQGLDLAFELALSTFGPYSSELIKDSPLRLVRSALLARRAETWYRANHRLRARQLWQQILREDRADLTAVQNLAVCDACSQDAAAQASSWRAWLELLHLYDIVSGEFRDHHIQRARFHRAVADSYLPSFLREKLDNDFEKKIDVNLTLAFLQDGPRLKEFVEHKLLEVLNLQLGRQSAHLVLGVHRGANNCEQARERMLDFSQTTLSALSSRLEEPFTALARQHIQQAFAKATSKEKFKEEELAVYQQEYDQQLKLLADIAKLKYKLFVVLKETPGLAQRLTVAPAIRWLARLDAIPLDLSEEIGGAVAGSLGIPEVETLANLVSIGCQNLLHELLPELFTPGDAAHEARCNAIYRDLVQAWTTCPELKETTPLAHHSGNFYPNSIQKLREEMEASGVPAELIEILDSWRRRYPGFTGVARDLAHLYLETERFDDALYVMDLATIHGIDPEGRQECRTLCLQLKFRRAAQNEEFTEALNLSQMLVDEDDHTPNLTQDYLSICRRVHSQNPTAISADTMSRIVNAWLNRTEKRLNAWKPSRNQPNPPCKREALGDIRDKLQAAITELGGLKEELELEVEPLAPKLFQKPLSTDASEPIFATPRDDDSSPTDDEVALPAEMPQSQRDKSTPQRKPNAKSTKNRRK